MKSELKMTDYRKQFEEEQCKKCEQLDFCVSHDYPPYRDCYLKYAEASLTREMQKNKKLQLYIKLLEKKIKQLIKSNKSLKAQVKMLKEMEDE